MTARIPRSDTAPLTTLELFAGAGGLALGTHKAGFQHLALVEWNKYAVDTLRENGHLLGMDDGHIHHSDAREVDYRPYIGRVDLLTGGPPCQPFSTGGRNQGAADTRDMFPFFLDTVATIRPKLVLIENVKGLMRPGFVEYVDYLLKRLEFPHHAARKGESWAEHLARLRQVRRSDFNLDEQYDIQYQLVDAADYGIPQRRERVLFAASRRDLAHHGVLIPSPTHSKEQLLYSQWVTGEYWDLVKVLPCDNLTARDQALVKKLRASPSPPSDALPWRTVRQAIGDLARPVERGEQEVISNHVQHPGARLYKCHVGSFPDYPSKALKAGTHGTPGGENILNAPEENILRYFTTREAARLQTFPDQWHFHGTWGACIKQLGNAVPVDLVTAFATKLKAVLQSELDPREELIQVRSPGDGTRTAGYQAVPAHSEYLQEHRIPDPNLLHGAD